MKAAPSKLWRFYLEKIFKNTFILTFKMRHIELSSVQSSEWSSAKNWNWNRLWEATVPAARTESVDTFGESQHDLFVTHQWQKMDELFLKCPQRAAKTLLMDLYLSFVFVCSVSPQEVGEEVVDIWLNYPLGTGPPHQVKRFLDRYILQLG